MKQKRVIFLTGHFPIQKRKASISWLVESFREDGWAVDMVTVGYSWLSLLKGDKRFETLYEKPKMGEFVHDETLTSHFGLSPIHPFSLKNAFLDKLARPLHTLFEAYWHRKLARLSSKADMIIIESGPPIMLTPIVRKHGPNAKLVYRVNDDVRVLGLPEFLAKAEQDYAGLFDRISMTSPVLAKRFQGRSDKVHIDPIGVNKAILEKQLSDPFANRARADREAVCAGTTLFDLCAVESMAKLRPNWNFHIIGRHIAFHSGLPDNLILHGELDYESTIAWTKYADIGLAPYLDKAGVEYQITQSNRMLIYRYFGLPIIGPQCLENHDDNQYVSYEPENDDSMEKALSLLETKSVQTRQVDVHDWSALYQRILQTLDDPSPHQAVMGSQREIELVTMSDKV